MICEHDGGSMTAHDDKSISLLERKKRQWAQERDELENLWAPWENRTNLWPLSSRSQHTKIASIINHNQNRRETFSSQNSYRKNSLPPLIQNQLITKDRFEREGETSGYASDNPIQPTYLPRTQSGNQKHSQSGYESSSSRDDRSRWKKEMKPIDWETKDTGRLSGSANEPPNWLKRGLEQDAHIEVTNSSPSESPEQDDIENDRPFTGSSSMRSRTYIRGQNIRLDSAELAERERKREIALQHQQAIREQLEERERKRSEERRRRIQEEYEEELRIAKEQELERRRREEEQKLLQEKHEKEEKRKEAMKEAIEQAEKEAKLQKIKLKLIKQQKSINNFKNELNELHSVEIPTKECNNEKIFEHKKEKSSLTPRNTQSQKQNEDNKENLNNAQLMKTDNRTTEISIKNNLEGGHCSKEFQNNLNENLKKSFQAQQDHKEEPVTIVIPSSFETLQHFKYAVLMSIPSNSSIPVAIPIIVASENTPQNAVATVRTENRILTPTQYRQRNKMMIDSSTQTEEIRNEKCSRDKTNTENMYENRSRKGRTSSRNENVSDRPKWGANRPPTRYLKQSEKDLMYQRKKSRQKNEDHLYDDKNSSDESQLASPRYRKRGHLEKRHPRQLWRNHASKEVFRRDVRMYHTELVPIGTDKNNVCFEHRCCCKCRCTGNHAVESTVDILTVEHGPPESNLLQTLISNSNENLEKIIEPLPFLENQQMVKEQWNVSQTSGPSRNVKI